MKKLTAGAFTLALLAMGIATPRASAREITPSDARAFGECIGFCMICEVFELKYMTIPASPTTPGNDTDDNNQCGHHTECQFECRQSLRSDIKSVGRVVAASDPTALVKLLTRTPGVEYNVKRHAIQIVGCNSDQIVAYFPLDQQMAHDVQSAVHLWQ